VVCRVRASNIHKTFACEQSGGKFDADGNLISGIGKLPINTDGGGLCNNHPANRGSMTKVLEAVRQLRGEAHPAVQVKNCDLALAQGTGFQLATRSWLRDDDHGTGVKRWSCSQPADSLRRSSGASGAPAYKKVP
jgi:hypothetical protein